MQYMLQDRILDYEKEFVTVQRTTELRKHERKTRASNFNPVSTLLLVLKV